MILLKQGEASQDMIVTLNEKRTLEAGYYLFVFTHITTKAIVNKIYAFSDDDSNSQDRYNEFEIDTATVFSEQPVGQWIYQVYEQASAVNTDVTGLMQVERGIMVLQPAAGFEYEQYNEPTTFKAYGG